ncbi:transcriptional regulator [Chryseobacterium arachidis]|uniref:helix-turn-helix transcriptional regulator n=1 Tax=Chryseobacterium arachidis TaxID=1416778 RepID=UPI00360B3CCD
MKPNNLTVDRTAKLLGITRTTMSNIVNGKSVITLSMAISLILSYLQICINKVLNLSVIKKACFFSSLGLFEGKVIMS